MKNRGLFSPVIVMFLSRGVRHLFSPPKNYLIHFISATKHNLTAISFDSRINPNPRIMNCPNCRAEDFRIVVPQNAISEEIDIRERFVLDRIMGNVTKAELKDKTDFVHNTSADILVCRSCQVLARGEEAESYKRHYEEDHYDEQVMDHLLKRYIQAFREKKKYREMLPIGSSVLEIGSHVGGFLHVAREWGWDSIGVDIGRDIAQFVNKKGYRTYNKSVEECGFKDGQFDGIFIWNCFEQLSDPHGSLETIKRILKPQGILVIRVPNGLFYMLCEMILETKRKVQVALQGNDPVIQALAYNNLLGFPHQYGYSGSNLDSLLQKHGFTPIKRANSALITLPLAKTPSWAIEEEKGVLLTLESLAQGITNVYPETLLGPWIEITYQKN